MEKVNNKSPSFNNNNKRRSGAVINWKATLYFKRRVKEITSTLEISFW